MVTARATPLRWLLKTLILKKKVLPLMVNDVVPQSLEMETSCSAYQCRKAVAGKRANGSKNTCKETQHLCTCCLVPQSTLRWQIKREHKKVSKIEGSALCPMFLDEKPYSKLAQGSLGTLLPSRMQNILVSPLEKVLCHSEL